MAEVAAEAENVGTTNPAAKIPSTLRRVILLELRVI
jgi:hypothetical protein